MLETVITGGFGGVVSVSLLVLGWVGGVFMVKEERGVSGGVVGRLWDKWEGVGERSSGIGVL